MNSHLTREYFVIRTVGNDAIGLLSMLVPNNASPVYNFSLHRPEHKNTIEECMDLNYTSIDFAEFETHLEAFETLKELDVVETWVDSTNTIKNVLLKKPEKADDSTD